MLTIIGTWACVLVLHSIYWLVVVWLCARRETLFIKSFYLALLVYIALGTFLPDSSLPFKLSSWVVLVVGVLWAVIGIVINAELMMLLMSAMILLLSLLLAYIRVFSSTSEFSPRVVGFIVHSWTYSKASTIGGFLALVLCICMPVWLARVIEYRHRIWRRLESILHIQTRDKRQHARREVVETGDLAVVEALHSGTPLHRPRDADAARILLDHGAAVDATDEAMRTPLFHAESPELVRLLLEHGANPNHRDKYGDTPLLRRILDMFNTRRGTAEDYEVFDVLIANGADPTIPDTDGDTAYKLARRAAEDGSDTKVLPILNKWYKKRS